MPPAVSWSFPERAELDPVARGMLAQWQVHLGDPSDAMRLLAHDRSLLAARMRAQGHAFGEGTGHQRAAMLLASFDDELATVTGTTPLPWRDRPPRGHARVPDVALPALDPSQQLLLCEPLRTADPAVRGVVMELLIAAFADADEGGNAWSTDLRIRLCTAAIPMHLRARWRAGLGLAPPDAVAPGDHRAGMRLVEQAFGDGAHARTVTLASIAPLQHREAVHVLTAALAVRVALRHAGELPAFQPREATTAAPDAAPEPTSAAA